MKKNISSIFLLAIVAALSVCTSCNKLSSATGTSTTHPTTSDSVVLKSNIFVIDSTQLTLVSSATQVSQGTYVFAGTSFPAFVENCIIIGITGDGYLRKVTSVTTAAGQVTLSTTQARLEDVFQQGNISFTAGISGPAGTTDNVTQYSFSNATLFQDGAASVKMTSGSLTLNSDWKCTMQFLSGAMSGFSVNSQNASLNGNLQLNVTATAADNFNTTDTIKTVTDRTIVYVGQIPVVVTTNLYFIANVSGAVSAAVNNNIGVTTNEPYSLGASYSGGAWQGIFSLSNNTTTTTSLSAAVSGDVVSCNIVPQTSIKLYGVVCPSASLPVNNFETATVTAASYMMPSIGVKGNVLGAAVPDYANSWTTDTSYAPNSVVTTTTDTLIKISGDNQAGTKYQYLSAPLVVRVTNNSGAAQSGISVTFSVYAGGGSLSTSTTTTDANGYAQTLWFIGDPSTAQQVVHVTAKTAGGATIPGSPLTFNAN